MIVLALTFVSAVVNSPVASSQSGWDDVEIGYEGNTAPGTLALDRGRPRVAYITPQRDLGYAWCNTDCGNRSSWESITLEAGDHPSPSIAVDRWGRPRIASIDLDADAVVYSACDTDCHNPGSWTHTKIASTSGYSGLSMALDPWGRPRLTYMRFPGNDLVFASCDQSCVSPKSWGSVVLNGSGGDFPSVALDGVRPRIAYAKSTGTRGTDLRYLSCESRCLSAGSWVEVTVTWSEAIGLPSLVVEGERAHVAFNPNTPAGVPRLMYTSCSSACTQADHWDAPVVAFPREAHAPVLEVTGGRPRVVFNECVNCATPAEEGHLYYASCDGGCSSAGNWSNTRLAPAERQVRSAGFALDGERPRVVYNDAFGVGGDLHYLFCDGCGAAGSWPPPPSSSPPSDDPPPSSSSTTSTTTPEGGSSGSGGGSSPSGGFDGGGVPGSGGGGAAGSSGGDAGLGSGSDSGADGGVSVSGAAAGPAGSAEAAGRDTGATAQRGSDADVGLSSVGRSLADAPGTVARLPGAAIDVVRDPSRVLSWPWGRLLLKGFAVILFVVVARLWQVEARDRREAIDAVLVS